MLRMADTNISGFLPIFAEAGTAVAFLVPTPTGYEKSIMDATAPIRKLLSQSGIHDYSCQPQGTDAKVSIKSYFVTSEGVIETFASLYRPRTKQGDPRIWFKHLRHYCCPYNLLAIVAGDDELFVFNLSDATVAESLLSRGTAYRVLGYTNRINPVAEELLRRLQEIHNRGFLPSITPGDPGVGDTLEYALGIARNNRNTPDYHGIELKAKRITRNGNRRPPTRQTLLAKVPDFGMSYKEIVQAYGKWQSPDPQGPARLQLYETFKVSRSNAYGLALFVDDESDTLQIYYCDQQPAAFVSGWNMDTLRRAISVKHRETFWVQAEAIYQNGREYFRYDIVQHTRGPNVSLLPLLFQEDKITVDLAGHFRPDGSFRDHGALFKMWPADLHLLVGTPAIYTL